MAAKRQQENRMTVSDTTLYSMTERMDAAEANGHDRYTALTHQELLQIAIRHRRSIAGLQDEAERLRAALHTVWLWMTRMRWNAEEGDTYAQACVDIVRDALGEEAPASEPDDV